MPIRTVIFDIGRTLIPFSLEPWQAAAVHRGPEFLALAEAHELGRVPSAEFRQRIGEITGLAGVGVDAWWNSIFEDRWLIPPEWIRGLRPQFRVGLLSNTNATHFEYLRRWLMPMGGVDFEILSHEVGLAKPDPAIYAAAEAAAGCAPAEIVYWDDVPDFVAAARARGWQAEQFTGWEAMRRAAWVVETLAPTR